MFDRIRRGFGCLLDHYTVACMFLALFILTWVGVGDMRTVSMLGLLLCVAGMAQSCARADPWILIPLILYDLASLASTWAAYGNIIDGYGTLHAVYPVLYLLTACLEEDEQRALKQFCILWTGVAAAFGIGQFLYRALWQGSPRRMGGFLGNPNAMGIFLAVGWCVLQGFLPEQGDPKERIEGGRKRAGKRRPKGHSKKEPEGPNGGEPEGQAQRSVWTYIEPVLLLALTLTLSMGSFMAMAVGILVLLAGRRRRTGNAGAFRYGIRLLAKASLGVGTGMLLYLGAARSGVPFTSLLVLGYAGLLLLWWERFRRFLKAYPRMALVVSGCGGFVAAAAVLVRPSASATFAERLVMMQNGLRYLPLSPLWGVGPYRWRYLNLADSDRYFNTWHIHNVLLHVGVEFGWIAMAMLAFVAARAFKKKTEPSAKAGLAAFCAHNMIDTSFFYIGITSLVLMAAGAPGCGGKRVGGLVLKVFFGTAALLFAYSLYQGLRMA